MAVERRYVARQSWPRRGSGRWGRRGFGCRGWPRCRRRLRGGFGRRRGLRRRGLGSGRGRGRRQRRGRWGWRRRSGRLRRGCCRRLGSASRRWGSGCGWFIRRRVGRFRHWCRRRNSRGCRCWHRSRRGRRCRRKRSRGRHRRQGSSRGRWRGRNYDGDHLRRVVAAGRQQAAANQRQDAECPQDSARVGMRHHGSPLSSARSAHPSPSDEP